MVETRSGRSVGGEHEGEGEHERSASPRGGRHRDTAGTSAAEEERPRRGGRGARGASGRGAAAAPAAPPLTDSQAYTLLALLLLLCALPLGFTPKLAARAIFGSAAYPSEDQHTHTLGLMACGLVAAASMCFALEECARRHMLHTFTADTLKLGLASWAGLGILLQLYYPATVTPLAAVASLLSNALVLALPVSQLATTAEDRSRVWRDFRRLPRNLRRAVSLRKPSMPGALYLVLTAALPGAGAAYLLAPKSTLMAAFGYAYGKSTYLAWKAAGAALLTLFPAITYTLKDKAEAGLLGRALSRTLNLGLLGASVGHLLLLGPILNHGNGGWLLPGLTATWATALLSSMAGLAAPEAAALMEAAEHEAATVPYSTGPEPAGRAAPVGEAATVADVE